MERKSVIILLFLMGFFSLIMIGCGKKNKAGPQNNQVHAGVMVKNIAIGNDRTVKKGEQFLIEFDFTASEELGSVSILWTPVLGESLSSISSSDNQLVGKKSGHFKRTWILEKEAEPGKWRVVISGNLAKEGISVDLISEVVTVIE